MHKNINHELPIKNLIVVYPDYLEVELTQGERTKVSKQDLDIIQNDVWCYHHGYAININGIRLHNVIMEYEPKGILESVDHIDRDKLNNQRSN